MSGATKRSSGSGNHPAVVAWRKKLDSIAEGTMPALERLNARIDRALKKAAPHDPRREPEDDERREADEVADDVVVLDGPPSRGARQ